MTGFFATSRGSSFTKDSFVARLRISGSNRGRARTPLEISVGPSCLGAGFRSGGDAVADAISSSSFLRRSEEFSVQHLEMLDDRTKGEHREIRKCAHNEDSGGQEDHK